MPSVRNERGVARAAIVTALSALLGAGVAAAAVATVVQTQAPDDAKATSSGLQAPVDPGNLIEYGAP